MRSGRNRGNEKAGPVGHVVGSYIAHAEINALATLPPGDYSDHTLYTTLEPCFLCTAALRHSQVGVVRFAAPDPMRRGVERLPHLNDQMARRWTDRDGPLGGHLQIWAAVLPLVLPSNEESGPFSSVTPQPCRRCSLSPASGPGQPPTAFVLWIWIRR